MNNKILGRGLSSLLSENVRIENKPGNTPAQHLQIAVALIEPNPWQPRKTFNEKEIADLAKSIETHGIIQPIVLRKHFDKYQIIAGERRFRASLLIGLDTVPAHVVSLSDKEMLEVALIENIQRQDLNPIDEALAFAELLKNSTQLDLSKRVGKSRSYIANSVRLLTLPEDVKTKLANKEISVGHARALIGNPDASNVANIIEDRKLNVRQVEKEFATNPEMNDNDEAMIEIESALTDALGVNVKIKAKEDGGIITIEFHNLEELDQITTRLSGIPIY